LLNVATGTIAGSLGLGFLLRTLDRLVVIQEDLEIKQPKPEPQANPGQQAHPPITNPTSALDRAGKITTRRAKSVFRVWTTVFALVGAQMSWVLRPLIGSPALPFEWFRVRESNFFIAVLHSLISLFSS
jgi:hypothetical protein